MNEQAPSNDKPTASSPPCGGGALLIGVEDYSTFDVSRQKDLPAGRNDVLAWWKVCRRLGFTRIRTLTSPALLEQDIVRAELELVPELSPGETDEEVVRRVKSWLADQGGVSVALGEANAQAVKQGVRWLAGTLEAGPGKAQRGLPGILTYSGHGARGQDDLLLCPSDTGPSLENALPFAELRRLFEEAGSGSGRHPTDSLTIFLDCCFAASGEPSGKGERVTTLTQAPAGKPAVAKAEIGNRVFCASARDRQSHQAMLGGSWHGAFTWAVTVALEQWQLAKEKAEWRSTMSHAELLFRARTLLRALSFYQHPVLVDELSNLPVFHEGTADGDDTDDEPTAWRPGVQMDPGTGSCRWYQISQLGTGGVFTPIANVLVVGSTAVNIRAGTTTSSYAANTEYWFDVSTAGPTASGPLNVYCTDYVSSTDGTVINPPALGNFCFTMRRLPTWSSNRTSATPVFSDHNGILGWGLTWNITWNADRSTWGGNVAWYITDSTTGLFADRFGLQTGNTEDSYYSATCTPNETSG